MKVKKMRKLLVIILVGMLSACAVKMTAQGLGVLKGRALTLAVTEPSGLQTQTAGKALLLGPVFGGMAAMSQGAGIVRDNNIPDPALSAGRALARGLAKRYALREVNADSPIKVKGVSSSAFISQVPEADLLLVMMTNLQQTRVFVTDMNNYQTDIVMWARLIDAKTKTEIAAGSCKYQPEYKNTNDAPTWAELFENGAAGYKRQVSEAAAYCAEKLAKDVFTVH